LSSSTSPTSATDSFEELSAPSSGALLWVVYVISIRACKLRTSSNRIAFDAGLPRQIPLFGGIFAINTSFFCFDTKNGAAAAMDLNKAHKGSLEHNHPSSLSEPKPC